MTAPAAAFSLALHHHQAGDSPLAEAVCRQILDTNPHDPGALHLLGVLAHQAGRHEAAIDLIRRAIDANGSNPEFHYNLGVAQHVIGRLDEAASSYRETLRLQSDHAGAHNNLGHALLTEKRHDEALHHLAHAIQLRPDYPEALTNLGKALEETGKLEEAAQHFGEAVRLQPDNPLYLNSFGNVLTLLDRLHEALPIYEKAVSLQPSEAVYRSNLANVLIQIGRPAGAEAQCREALRLRSNFANAYHNLGIALSTQGNFDGAWLANKEALRLEPEHPGARNCQGLWQLQRGNFELGWPEYEWRWKTRQSGPRAFREPLWDGSSLAGRTILIYAEQGLGDTLHFVRYLPLVKRRGGTVVFECQACLTALLARCPGIDQLVPRNASLPPFDVQAPLLSLPRIFGTTVATIPDETPYVFADPDLAERWGRELGGAGTFTIGIAWQGNAKFPGDCMRSIPLARFAPLARVPGVRLVSLQKGEGTEQIAALAGAFSVLDLGDRLDPGTGAFVDTAAVMKSVDLVVTSDTAIAHLAGALGVPVWVALAVGSDWRWLRDRDDSPWYPTMRLFRQQEFNDWSAVFERIATELPAQMARARPRPKLSEVFAKAVAHHQAGDLAGAKRVCDDVLRAEPGHAEALNLRGVLSHQAGANAEAVEWLTRAVASDPSNAGYYYNLGVAHQVLDQLDDAVASYRQALRLQPNHADAHNNLGFALAKQKRQEEAAAHYRRAVYLRPDFAEAWHNLGIVMRQLGQLEEAIGDYRQAVRLKPDHVVAWHNLGLALAGAGKPEEALESYGRALALRPDYPEARFGRSLVWLLRGEFERGWPEYEWRWKCKHGQTNPHVGPLWDCSPLAGRTILLHAEQGLGDVLQFIRFAPLVKGRGGTVIVECPASLAALLAGCAGMDRLVPRGTPLPPYDVQAPLLSLPGIFGTTLVTIPAKIPYLSADPGHVEKWGEELKAVSGLKVGIAWQGDPNYLWDRYRSIPLRQFAALAEVPGLKLVGLQKGAGREQVASVVSRFDLIDLGDRLDETGGAFTDTAAVMKCLDLVITSDTAVAHLAGALGVPVWVALSSAPDWRWLLQREDSPWYPTMRLFRQSRLGEWDDVFARMAAELRGRVESPPSAGPIHVEIGPGELIDKITILEIKIERIADAGKLRNVRAELAALTAARDRSVPPSERLAGLTADLKAVNEQLWCVEDELRGCERDHVFDARFVELARSVYRHNDRRADLKRQVNDLLGARLIEEKSYAAYQGRVTPRATICILTYGDYLPYFQRCLDSILAATPRAEIELRLGFNDAPGSRDYAQKRLDLDRASREEATLPGGVTRTCHVCSDGLLVRTWDSPVNLYKEPMARLLYHDIPIATEYAVWFDDDSYVEAGWWEATRPLLDRKVDYIGQSWVAYYLSGQAEMIREQPWYRGVAFEMRDGKPCVSFMTGGFVALRAERLREANFPDVAFAWNGETLKQYGGDTLLGEIARQSGWSRAAHHQHVHVNVDLRGNHPAPRRGGTGRQFGSDVDVPIG
jgi:tetratricopeptide (TPR) repeat protein